VAGASFAAPAASAPEKKQRKIVVFRDGTNERDRDDAVQEHGGRVRRRLARLNAMAVEMSEGRVKAMRRHWKVKGVYDDLKMRASGVIKFTPWPAPATEMYPWGQQRIGIPAVHQLLAALPLSQVRVAVVDTGLDMTHPELQASIVGGFNAIDGGNPSNYQDDNGHGTHMAGIIAAAANGQGIIGMSSHILLTGVKVLDHNGAGYLSDLLEGLEWVLNNNIQVANLSLSFDHPSPLMEQAIQQLYEAGVIVVGAVGNKCKPANAGTTANDDGGDDDGGDDDGGDDDGGDDDGGDDDGGDDDGGDDDGGDDDGGDDDGGDDDGGDDDGGDDDGGDDDGGDDDGGDDDGGDNAPSACDVVEDPRQGGVKYPAAYPEVIAVAGVDKDNHMAPYSRRGPEVDLVAPGGAKGGKILSTIPGGLYAYGAGTSQATAHVSGAIAVMLQLVPGLSQAQVLDLLHTTALDLGHPAEQQGVGLIDVEGMVQSLLGLP
jgi:subtilisin/minor extracellular protease Epr